MASPSWAPARLACFKSVLLRLAPVRLALLRLAPPSWARCRMAPVRLAPARLATDRSKRLSLAPARAQPGQSLLRPANSSPGSAARPGVADASRNARTRKRGVIASFQLILGGNRRSPRTARHNVDPSTIILRRDGQSFHRYGRERVGRPS